MCVCSVCVGVGGCVGGCWGGGGGGVLPVLVVLVREDGGNCLRSIHFNIFL